MGHLKFNGISTEDLGLVIQTPPSYSYPEKNIETVTIPGRNGSMFIDNKSYKQTSRSYLVAKEYPQGSDYMQTASKIVEWLNAPNGEYVRLEDTYDPGVFRLATYIGSGTVTNYFNKAMAMTITFNCKPQRFLYSGEDEVKISGNNEITVYNPTVYASNPLISVSGFVKDNSVITMLTVYDYNNYPTCNITLTSVPASTEKVIIDSEDQVVYDQNQNDLSYQVNTNGKDFPSLGKEQSTIKVEKYLLRDKKDLPTYKSLITETEKVCKALYMSKEDLELKDQKSTFFKSYDALLSGYQQVYVAKSVLALADEKCKRYTFPSFNEVLSSDLLNQYSISKDELYAEPAGDEYTDLIYTKMSADGKYIYVYANQAGFYRLTSDKRIHYVSNDKENNHNKIGELGINDLQTLYCYKTKTVSGEPVLDYGYPDLEGENPQVTWVKFEIEYELVEFYGVRVKCPLYLRFKTNAAGYHYFLKSGLFGNDYWLKKTANDESVEIQSLKWSTTDKCFKSTRALETSKTYQVTCKYLEDVPQYEDVVETYEQDGKTKKRYTHVRFTVSDVSTDGKGMTTCCIKMGYDTPEGELRVGKGWYRFKLDKNADYEAWGKRDEAGDTIKSTFSGKDAFEVASILYTDYAEEDPEHEGAYIPAIPDYRNESDWPSDILDPKIYNSSGEAFTSLVGITSSTNIYIKPVITSNFKVSYADENDNDVLPDTWQTGTAGEVLAYGSHAKTINDSYRIVQIDEIPTEYERNRCYQYAEEGSEEELHQNPPEYLSVEFNPSDPSEEDPTPDKIIYHANKPGYYKIDNAEVWRYFDEEEFPDDEDDDAELPVLVESVGTDTTTVAYMKELPRYDLSGNVWDNWIEIPEPLKDDGNPSEIQIKAKINGFFRFNSDANWSYVEAGNIIISSEINAQNVLRYLEPEEMSAEEKANIEIAVIPRWWTL